MFTKHLQELTVPDLAVVVRELGFDGVELTVRPGGHVAPERVGDDLPRAVEILASHGLTVPAIVVEIHGHASPFAAEVCQAAGRVGATVLRTSSRRYNQFGAIRQEIASAKAGARELEQLGQEHGVRLCIHCHSGPYLSASGATLAEIVDETDPRFVGVSLDIGHLTVEGGGDGWRQSIDLLRDRIGIVAVKSFGWFAVPDPSTEGTRYSHQIVPLREGNARWAEALGLLRTLGWDADGRALVSLHSEYQGGETWQQLDQPALVTQTRADLAWFRRQAIATT